MNRRMRYSVWFRSLDQEVGDNKTANNHEYDTAGSPRLEESGTILRHTLRKFIMKHTTAQANQPRRPSTALTALRNSFDARVTMSKANRRFFLAHSPHSVDRQGRFLSLEASSALMPRPLNRWLNKTM